jgi:hypothetical protein
MLASTRAGDLDKTGRTESHRKGCGSDDFPYLFGDARADSETGRTGAMGAEAG